MNSASNDNDQVVEPLVVRPVVARRLLGGMSTEKLWELLGAGELDSYKEGQSRFIVVSSIHAYIKRRLATSSAIDTARVTKAVKGRQAQRRRAQ